MAFDSLRDFLGSLERMGELKHIKAEVEPVHELGAIAYHSLLKKGPALLFENVKGHKTPIVTNVLSTDKKMAVALGMEGDMRAMFEKFLSGFKNPIVPVEVKGGPCKEEIYKDDAVDITKFPTPVWHEKDAGPYLGTFHGCITKDRATGDQNMGMYRLLVKDKKLCGCRFTATVWRTTVNTKRRTTHAHGRRHRYGAAAMHRRDESDQFGIGAPRRVCLRRRAARQAGGAHQVRDSGCARSRASGDRA